MLFVEHITHRLRDAWSLQPSVCVSDGVNRDTNVNRQSKCNYDIAL